MSWNGFPASIRKSLIYKLKRKYFSETKPMHDITEDMRLKIWFRLPYVGKTGGLLVKSCIKKDPSVIKNSC